MTFFQTDRKNEPYYFDTSGDMLLFKKTILKTIASRNVQGRDLCVLVLAKSLNL